MTTKTQTKQVNAIFANGTSLKGYVTTSREKLIEAFGQPSVDIPATTWEKVTTEWVLKFQDGTIATIYDWKGYGYKPSSTELYEWHIGGHSTSAVALVREELGLLP